MSFLLAPDIMGENELSGACSRLADDEMIGDEGTGEKEI